MMGRITLKEAREALAAAKAKKGAKASAPAPLVQELESLARLLEQEPKAGTKKEKAEPGGAADGGGHGGSRRSARPRGPRRR
jgi:hypothetical protein